MALLGLELLFDRPPTALVLTAIALVSGALAGRIASPILYLHGAVYLIAAISRSGLLAATTTGFAGAAVPLADWAHVPVLLALAVTLAYPWLPRPGGRSTDVFLERRATELFVFASVFALGGCVVALGARLSPGGAEADIYPRFLATIRTGVLAVAAVLLARYNRRTRFGDLTWMVYTILLLGAVKLLFQDIAAGGAAALFLSLGLYGGALILAPRMLHVAKRGAQLAEAGTGVLSRDDADEGSPPRVVSDGPPSE
jgi:hypothetical protein